MHLELRTDISRSSRSRGVQAVRLPGRSSVARAHTCVQNARSYRRDADSSCELQDRIGNQKMCLQVDHIRVEREYRLFKIHFHGPSSPAYRSR